MTPLDALKKYFGYDSFRPGQEEIIGSILNGKNVLAVLPTGAGKSLCYQIPALVSPNFSIVISPLIALMKDQVDKLNISENHAEFINSTMSFGETEEVFRKLRTHRIKLLYVAPERLENTGFAERIKELIPEFIFVDEAHCISQWGHNFRPSYTRIKDFIEFTGVKKTAAFTATATPEVVKDIISQLNLKDPQLFVRGFERENISINVIVTKNKREKCLELIKHYKTPAIIYTSSRKKAEEAAEYHILNRVNCSYYHAGLPAEVRRKIQDDFINDKTPVIAATNAFGMGIDKKNIRLIIHFNMPGTIENYYQEIGRAGRDGKESAAFLLYDDSDINIHNYFLSNSHPDKELIQSVYNAICDYGRVAVGSPRDKEIPLNIDYIASYTHREMNRGLLYNIISILEAGGYLRMQTQFDKRDSVLLIAEKTRLKQLIEKSSNDILKILLMHFLREYGSSIFTGKKDISISDLSNQLGYSTDEIDEALIILDNLGLIKFEKALQKDHVYLNGTRIAANMLRLDYKKINEGYLHQQKKLDQMVEFVFSSGCRFKYILQYFGEDVSDYNCNKCDNCTRGITLPDSTITYIGELALRTVDEKGGALNETTIRKILKGTMPGREYKKLSTYGSCTNYNASDLNVVIHHLLTEGLLNRDRKNTRSLVITDSGYKQILPIGDTRSKLNEGFGYEVNLELFNLLREARTAASKKFMQSAYLICPDHTLRDIAERKPKNSYELLSVKGFNERMFNKIGEQFLEIINEFLSEKQDKQTDKKQVSKIPANLNETLNLLKKEYPLRDMASLRNLSEAVISMQIESIIEYMPEVNVTYLFPDGLYEKITNAAKKGYSNLKELKSKLPDEATYPLIRIAVAKLKATQSA